MIVVYLLVCSVFFWRGGWYFLFCFYLQSRILSGKTDFHKWKKNTILHIKTEFDFSRLTCWEIPQGVLQTEMAKQCMWTRRQKEGESQRCWATPRKQYLLDTTGLIYIGIHRDYNSIPKSCTSSNQTKSQYGEREVG